MNQFLDQLAMHPTTSSSLWLTLSISHFLWQGVVWATLATALAWLLSAATAQARYLVHVMALAGMTLGFALTLWCCRPIASVAETGFFTEELTASSTSGYSVGETSDGTDTTSSTITVEESNGAKSSITARPDRWNQMINLIAPYAAVLYLIGVALMVARLLTGMLGGHWLSQKSGRVTDPVLLQLLELQVHRMSLKVTPLLVWCQRVSVPVVVGVIQPTILLPLSLANGLSPDQISAILAHELAHIRRHDLIINLLQRIVEAILFFHPAVWYISRRIRIERENCCDDLVISAGWQRVAYVDALLRMAELSVWQRGLTINLATVAASGNNSSEFKRRILRLLSVPADAAISVSRTAVLVMAVLSVIGLSTFLLAQQTTPSGTTDKAAEGKTTQPLQPLTAVVVKADGTPAADIDVTSYFDDGRLLKTLKTDAQGQITIPGEWAAAREYQRDSVTLLAGDGVNELGWYSFHVAHYRAEMEGRQTAEKSGVVPSPIKLTLTSLDRTIRGRLLNDKGRGLPGVRVFVTDWKVSDEPGLVSAFSYGRGLPLPATTTDAEGHFELKVPAKTSGEALTSSNQYCQVSLTWRKDRDELGEQALKPGGRLKGYVLERETMKRLPNALVSMRGISLDGRWGSFGSVMTSANGEYETAAMLPDHYKITARVFSRPDLVPVQPVRAPVTAGISTETIVVLGKGTLVKGRVVDLKSSQPIANEPVNWQSRMSLNPQAPVDFGGSTRTNDTGRFELIAPAGALSIRSDNPRRATTPESVRIIQVQEGRSPAEVVLQLGQPVPDQLRAGTFEAAVPAPSAKSEASAPDTTPPDLRRPNIVVQLQAPDRSAIGEYVVRTVFPPSNYVNEWSIKEGTQFTKKFLPREVGRTAKLLVDVPGYTPVWTSEFPVQLEMKPISLRLEPEIFTSLAGRVVSPENRPLADARVRVRRVFYGRDSKFPYGPEVRTDSEGRFTITSIRQGEDVNLVIDDESQPELGHVETPLILIKNTGRLRFKNAKPLSLPYDIVLSMPDQQIAGTVQDQDGELVAGATVSYLNKPERETKTDKHGRFRLDRLPRGRLTLDVTGPDGSHTTQTVASGSQDAKLFVSLTSLDDRPENLLKLSIRTPDTKQSYKWAWYLINDATHSVAMSGQRTATGSADETIDLGSWLRNGKDPRLSLIVTAAGHRASPPVPLKLRPKIEPVTIDLQPAHSPRLTIKVIDSSKQPVVGATVSVVRHLTPEVSEADHRWISNVPPEYPMTDAQGVCQVTEYPAGFTVSVYANAAGFAGQSSAIVTLDTDREITVALQPATRTISGTVLDQEGKPIVNALVKVHDVSRAPNLTVTSRPDGSFRIEKVPNGPLLMSCRAFGYDDTSTRVAADTALQPIKFTLPREPGAELAK